MAGVIFCFANHEAIWSPFRRDWPMTGVTGPVGGVVVVAGAVLPPAGAGACDWAARADGTASDAIAMRASG
jgi:hypothetical protein